MPRIKVFGSGYLARPLLDWTRAELKAYAETEQLTWVEDELNQDAAYPRNHLRHEFLPRLKQHWPTATKTLARSAELCAEAQDLLDEYADRDLALVAGSQAGTLSVKRLLELSAARQRLILRRWFESRGALMPSAVKLRQLQQDVLEASEDSQPCVAWAEVELRRYQDELYLLKPLVPHEPGSVYHWDFKAPLVLHGIGSLEAKPLSGQGLQRRLEKVEVRFRQGGEVYRLPSGQRHELKKFFQEQGIPPWERDRLPLLFAEGELIAIPGYFVAGPFRAQQDEEGWVVGMTK